MKAKLPWRPAPALSARGAAAGTRRLLALAVGALLALPVLALPATEPCASARDPVRCDARQAALKACAAKRGTEKQACIEAGMPPPDCRLAKDPPRCEAEQRAREICSGKAGTELRKCLRDEQPRKAGGKRRANS